MDMFNFKGVVFVLVGKIGSIWLGPWNRVRLMTWKEISIISKKGWEIGSHTMNHYILTALSPQRLDEELFLSKKVLKENGYDAISVSYPGGITDHKVVEVARKYYQIGRVAIDLGHWNPIVNTGIVNRFALKSFTLSEKTFSEVGLKTLLNDLRKQGGWGIFLIHSVVDLLLVKGTTSRLITLRKYWR